jgi:uncharacterized membrane protein
VKSRQFIKNPQLLALTATLVSIFGFFFKLPCASTGWGGSSNTYLYLCYSDVGPLYYVRGFADGIFPYIESYNDRFLEYPVLTGMWMWLVAQIVQTQPNPGYAFVYLTWFSSMVMIVIAIHYLHKLRPNRAWWFALSPALFLTLGINWDAAAVLASILGLYWWRTGKSGRAGIALGIGAAFKLFPLLLLLPFLVDAIRKKKINEFAASAFFGATSWLVVNLPFYLTNAEGWWEFYRFSRERGIDFGSVWLALDKLLDFRVSTDTANYWASLIVAATAVVLILLSKRIDIFTAAFVFVAVFALVNKVYSPQFVLWLAPLAVLSGIKLKHFVVWQIFEVIYYVAIWRYLLGLTEPDAYGGISEYWYGVATAGHILATSILVGIALFNSVKNRGFSGRLSP